MLTFTKLPLGFFGHTGSSVHTSAAGALHGGGGGSFRLPGDPVRPTLGTSLSSALSALKSKGSSKGPVVRPAPVASVPSAQSLDYLNADLAKHYGMSKETAYSEALSNTAYQRAVKDMQAAGLNPAVIYGAGRGSAADGVSYVSSASSGGGGGGGRSYRGRGGGKSSGKLFDQGTWGAVSAAAGLAGMAATKSPTGFWIGQTTAQGIMGAINSIFGR